jgi:hypothetical protein
MLADEDLELMFMRFQQFTLRAQPD